jgi:hypothetical protein
VRVAWLIPLLAVTPAAADPPGQCHVVDVDFFPQPDLQIVAWVEDAAGTFLDTIFITQSIGTYGLGNRPGRYDFNSGATWPYGRRITTFPVWSHRNGLAFPQVVFQNDDENDLSHASKQSSSEPHYCSPVDPPDAVTCASQAFTDKGKLSTTLTTGYPPRQDITRVVGVDTADVDQYAQLNPFDAISSATPAGNAPAKLTWAIPPNLTAGNYVMWLEVSKQFDMNDTYNPTTYPPPAVDYGNVGNPYRGQPSVVYKVPFTVSPGADTTALALDYTGYGDPTGATGAVAAPDATITTGATRFATMVDGDTFRVRVTTHNIDDSVAPAAPSAPAVVALGPTTATIGFVAPGDDGTIGTVTGYEVRYRVDDEITEDNFLASIPGPAIAPQPAGSAQSVEIDHLLPETNYSIGIRAFDDCHNIGPLIVVDLRTADRQAGAVDACFVATAAYGSKLAGDVSLLRRFRDRALRTSVLGELAVETYYTFGPAFAGAIGESDLLRQTARAVLDPIVAWVRRF